MPEALICPKCGAPLTAGASSCAYCHIEFSTQPSKEPAPSARQTQEKAEFQVPAGLEKYSNPWDGVALGKPRGWQVGVSKGIVSVRKDPVGLCAALIQPVRLRANLPPEQAASEWLLQARQILPNLQAWVVPDSTPDQSRISLRVQASVFNIMLVGNYCINVQGQNAMISGFLCPVNTVNQDTPLLQGVLSSFRMIERMPRQMIQENTEGAGAVWMPQGWIGQMSVQRYAPGGPGQLHVDVRREPAGLAQAAQPLVMWNFQEGGMPMFGLVMPGGPQSMAYQPAAQLCQSFLPGWLRQYHGNPMIENIDDRPDMVPYLAREVAKTGQDPQTLDLSAAVMTIRYGEANTTIRERLRLLVYHPRSMIPGMGFLGGSGFWSAFMDTYIRAPENEFEELEPILSGILDSIQTNPTWQQNELARTQGIIRNTQQDMMRRQRQISQTLSETSDLVNQGYWERQQTYDRLSHDWSNVILGYQDMTDSSNTVYNVPSGYDQYWRDGLDNIYAGGLLVNPDPTWTKLELKGQ